VKQRRAVLVSYFREDLRYWIETDRRMAVRIMRLLEAVMDDPFEGIGKPEPLKHNQPNTWSRRINEEHRMVYVVYDDEIHFIAARHHYQKS
jgi:toxin YoeB